MGPIIFLIVMVLLLGLAALFAVEPPSAQQRAAAVKRQIEQEKVRAMAEMDAASVAHKRQVFELVDQFNRQQVALQAEEARRRAQAVVAQAAQECE